MSEILEQLFNSKTRVRLLRLFLNHPEEKFSFSETASRIGTSSKNIRKEVNGLVKIKFLKTKPVKKKPYYFADKNFIFYDELRSLIFKANPASSKEIARKIKQTGQIKLVLISKSLINSEKGRVDLLVIGENFNKLKFKKFLNDIESEIGKEINYATMSADEFRYRKDMFDKFIIDIMEGPREILIDKLKIS